ncbi:MAG: FtsW/RodA/SpoVE family cell cycle protein [Rikenellaceae bacterium]
MEGRERKVNGKTFHGIKWFEGDRVLWIVIAVLAVVSLLVVYSSSAKMAYDYTAVRSTGAFLFQQFVFLGMGLVAVLFIHKINPKYFLMATPLLFWGFLALTASVYFLGVRTNGAARWIPIMGFQFQPSEGLKVATMLYLARALAVRQPIISTLKIVPSFNPFSWALPAQKRIWDEGTKPVLMPVLLACAVVAPAHTSSAVLLFFASMVVMVLGRVRWSELGKICLMIIAIVTIYMVIGAGRSETASGRVSTWVALWTSDRTQVPTQELADTERSMAAIHNGGLLGEGAGQSAMRVEMIHPESDYAYAFFVEEYGIIMAVLLLLLYLWIFFRSIEIFRRCSTAFPALMVLGIAVLITSQALLHIMVTVNLIPETGQTLPLISRGGSSFIFTSIALGMILSVSRFNAERRL